MEKSSALTMKEKLLGATEGSDMPTPTFVTAKAFVFYISAVVAIVSMFLNWFPLDVDLVYLNLGDILGEVNVFTLPGKLSDIKDGMDSLGTLMPSEVINKISDVHIFSVVLMIAAIGAIGCLIVSVYFRFKENDQCVKYGRVGGLLGVVAAIGFVILVNSTIGSVLKAIGATEAANSIMKIIMTGPCVFTLVAAVLAAVCAVMDMEFKEDVVIYHDGRMKIARGSKWKCRCGRMNLSPLVRCYYCGKDRQ